MTRRCSRSAEQFQEKCSAVFRPELRESKESERFRVSVKNGNALGSGPRRSSSKSYFTGGTPRCSGPFGRR
ncbi:hypothetical protein C1M53_06930 [Mesorhizobium sp. Pch-S]|nr:hypothetical protein C1M53_06930 [Mesorhizobium sp. Pch-S]